jgi:gamma-glutamylputrescine oxidase
VTSPHAPSLYAATADDRLAFPALSEPVRADVAIVGGGFTGLSAALHLAEAGVDVVLVEANRIGSGASGRNGGQLHSGQRRDQDWLEEHLGLDQARRLWALAEEAKATTLGLIDKHAIACEWRPGLIEAVHKPRLVADEIAYVDKLREAYGYDHVAWLDRAALAEAIGSDVYFGGRRDAGGGHLHPLRFAQGLARAAANAGARIFEGTRAAAIGGDAATGFTVACRGTSPPLSGEGEDGTPSTATIHADTVILAGNGYLAGIDREVEARVMPIDNYIVATAPIGAGQPGGLIAGGEAVSDTRFVVYYFRPSADGRLIFGGGETYGAHRQRDVAALVRTHLGRIYPLLRDTSLDYAWGGTLAITLNRLPYIRRARPGIYAAAGYSGQGIALAPFAGKVLAEAIAGNPGKLDTFAALPIPTFPGGALLRFPALVAAMTWYRLRDVL